jgi:hypothetical protein
MVEVASVPRGTVQDFYLAEARFDELTHDADVLARVDLDFAGARARYGAILAEVRAIDVSAATGPLGVVLATAKRERAAALVASLARLLASEKAAFAEAEGMGEDACANATCGCARCTCGSACTCGVSMEKTCDPCVAFKKGAAANEGATPPPAPPSSDADVAGAAQALAAVSVAPLAPGGGDVPPPSPSGASNSPSE